MPTTWRSREFFPAFLCLISIFSKRRREGMRAHFHLFVGEWAKKLVFFLFFHKEGIKEEEKSVLLSSSSIFLLIFLKQRWLETKEKNSLLILRPIFIFPKREEMGKKKGLPIFLRFSFPIPFLQKKCSKERRMKRVFFSLPFHSKKEERRKIKRKRIRLFFSLSSSVFP